MKNDRLLFALKIFTTFILLSFAQFAFGQNSFYFGLSYQSIKARGLNFADALPFELSGGYTNNKKLIGLSLAVKYTGNIYKQSKQLTPVTMNSKFSEERNTRISNDFIGVGIGPSLNYEVSENLRLRCNTVINFGYVYAKGDYTEVRNTLTPIEQNRFITSGQQVLSSQTQNSSQFTTYIKLALGADLINNVPIGVEIGWQNVDFGKTMNKLEPTGKFGSEKIITKTSSTFIGLILYLNKKKI